MNQNINLYLPEFRKQKHWLDAQSLLQISALALVLVLVGTAAEYGLYYRKQQVLLQVEQERDAAIKATTDLRASYGTQSQDQSLLDDIARMELELGNKQALLQFMQGRQLGNATGFSEYLADLSRFHVNGLSLRQIALHDGGNEVALGGDVLRAEIVPLFLQNLSMGAAYSGKRFQTLDITEKALDVKSLVQETIGSAANMAASPSIPLWNFTVTTAAGSTP